MAIKHFVTQEDLDRNHARIMVNEFLDSNGMYSNMGLDLLMIPEFLHINVQYVYFNGDTVARLIKQDNKVTFQISPEVNRTTALQIAYMLGYEFYNKKEMAFESKRTLEHFEEAYENIYYDTDLPDYVKKSHLVLTPEEKKLMVELDLKNKDENYVIELTSNFMRDFSGKAKDYVYFAEELVSRDYLPRFKQNKNNDFDKSF